MAPGLPLPGNLLVRKFMATVPTDYLSCTFSITRDQYVKCSCARLGGREAVPRM